LERVITKKKTRKHFWKIDVSSHGCQKQHTLRTICEKVSFDSFLGEGSGNATGVRKIIDVKKTNIHGSAKQIA